MIEMVDLADKDFKYNQCIYGKREKTINRSKDEKK
jgi:hypothetical protein